MPKTKYQLDDFLALVDVNYKDYITEVHEMMMQEGYKLKIQSTKTYGLHISYSQPKIKSVKGIIIYFLIQGEKLMIRINADHHAKYPEVLNRLPNKILDQMDKADDCKKFIDPEKCWQGCGGYDVHVGEKHYKKCILNCFLLDVDADNFPFLVELIKSEVKQRAVSLGLEQTNDMHISANRPTKPYEEVKTMLADASIAWEKLTGYIRYNYIMDEKWAEGKPTHKNRNNLYFQRGGKSLTILSLREGYFIVCVVLGKDERAKFDEQRGSFGEAVCKEYDNAENLHDGKWLGFEVHGDDTLLINDIIRLLNIKRKPNRKELPENLEKCGRLDIGLSHENITSLIVT